MDGLSTIVSVSNYTLPRQVAVLTNTTAGTYQTAFSDMARTSEGRKKFITGLITFMDTYGFDGADLDWEYPTAGK